MSISSIRKHMEVYAACGVRVGVVDAVDGERVRLMKGDSQAGGKHHFIPGAWVACVDRHVYLNRNAEDTMRDWQAEAEPSAVVTAD